MTSLQISMAGALAGFGIVLALTSANAETRLMPDTDGVVISDASSTVSPSTVSSSPLSGSIDGGGAEIVSAGDRTAPAGPEARAAVAAETIDSVPALQPAWKRWLSSLMEIGGGGELRPRPR